jgi:hypothetical protein
MGGACLLTTKATETILRQTQQQRKYFEMEKKKKSL